MATSGSVDYTVNRNELIREAFELIGVAVSGEALDPTDIGRANTTLNLMLKAFQAHDLKLWKRDELSLTLVAAQSTYSLGRSGTPDLTADRPLKVLHCEREGSDGNTSPLVWSSRIGVYDLPSTANSVPNQYHYEPTLDNGTLHVWPAPDAAAATEYTIKLLVQSPIEDMDNSTDNFDCPQEWLEAIAVNLAYRLSRKYPIPLNDRYILKKDAKETLELALGWDREDSIYLQPDTQGN